MTIKHRNPQWDNLKGLLITLVVVGHFLLYKQEDINAQRILFIIYSFHMPLFVFISGVMSKRAIEERDKSKALVFIGVFLLIKILTGLSRLATGQIEIAFQLFEIDDVSWYAFALAVFYMITAILDRYDARKIIPAAIILACMVGYDNSIDTTLSLSRIFVFYPFFLMGFYYDDRGVSKKELGGMQKLLCISILAFYSLIVVINTEHLWSLFGLLQGKYPYSKILVNFSAGGLVRFAWYLTTSIIIACMIIIAPKNKDYLKIGDNTLAIYILHNPIINLIMHSRLRLIAGNGCVTMIISGVLLSYGLSFFSIWMKRICKNADSRYKIVA